MPQAPNSAATSRAASGETAITVAPACVEPFDQPAADASREQQLDDHDLRHELVKFPLRLLGGGGNLHPKSFRAKQIILKTRRKTVALGDQDQYPRLLLTRPAATSSPP